MSAEPERDRLQVRRVEQGDIEGRIEQDDACIDLAGDAGHPNAPCGGARNDVRIGHDVAVRDDDATAR